MEDICNAEMAEDKFGNKFMVSCSGSYAKLCPVNDEMDENDECLKVSLDDLPELYTLYGKDGSVISKRPNEENTERLNAAYFRLSDAFSRSGLHIGMPEFQDGSKPALNEYGDTEFFIPVSGDSRTAEALSAVMEDSLAFDADTVTYSENAKHFAVNCFVTENSDGTEAEIASLCMRTAAACLDKMAAAILSNADIAARSPDMLSVERQIVLGIKRLIKSIDSVKEKVRLADGAGVAYTDSDYTELRDITDAGVLDRIFRGTVGSLALNIDLTGKIEDCKAFMQCVNADRDKPLKCGYSAERKDGTVSTQTGYIISAEKKVSDDASGIYLSGARKMLDIIDSYYTGSVAYYRNEKGLSMKEDLPSAAFAADSESLDALQSEFDRVKEFARRGSFSMAIHQCQSEVEGLLKTWAMQAGALRESGKTESGDDDVLTDFIKIIKPYVAEGHTVTGKFRELNGTPCLSLSTLLSKALPQDYVDALKELASGVSALHTENLYCYMLSISGGWLLSMTLFGGDQFDSGMQLFIGCLEKLEKIQAENKNQLKEKQHE